MASLGCFPAPSAGPNKSAIFSTLTGRGRSSRNNFATPKDEKMSSTSAVAVAAQKLTREDWRKKKELEEARKAGTAPAEVDEEGR